MGDFCVFLPFRLDLSQRESIFNVLLTLCFYYTNFRFGLSAAPSIRIITKAYKKNSGCACVLPAI